MAAAAPVMTSALHRKNFSFLIRSYGNRTSDDPCTFQKKTGNASKSYTSFQGSDDLVDPQDTQGSAHISPMTRRTLLTSSSSGPGGALASHPGIPTTATPLAGASGGNINLTDRPLHVFRSDPHAFWCRGPPSFCSKRRLPHCWHMLHGWKQFSLWWYLFILFVAKVRDE